MRDRALIVFGVLAVVAGLWWPLLRPVPRVSPPPHRLGAVDQGGVANAWVEGVANGYPVAVNMQALDGGAATQTVSDPAVENNTAAMLDGGVYVNNSATQAIPTRVGTAVVACSCTTYADAGAGIACPLADAGTPVQWHVRALSTNTASIFVGCSANVTATPGINQGMELPVANGFGGDNWETAACTTVYAVSTAASQVMLCEATVR